MKEKSRIEAPKPVGLITGPEENVQEERRDEEMSVVKATSVEEATQAVMAPRKDDRTAGVDGWKFKVEILIQILDGTLTIRNRLETLSCSRQTQIFHRIIRRPKQLWKRTKKGNPRWYHMEVHD